MVFALSCSIRGMSTFVCLPFVCLWALEVDGLFPVVSGPWYLCVSVSSFVFLLSSMVCAMLCPVRGMSAFVCLCSYVFGRWCSMVCVLSSPVRGISAFVCLRSYVFCHLSFIVCSWFVVGKPWTLVNVVVGQCVVRWLLCHSSFVVGSLLVDHGPWSMSLLVSVLFVGCYVIRRS